MGGKTKKYTALVGFSVKAGEVYEIASTGLEFKAEIAKELEAFGRIAEDDSDEAKAVVERVKKQKAVADARRKEAHAAGRLPKGS